MVTTPLMALRCANVEQTDFRARRDATVWQQLNRVLIVLLFASSAALADDPLPKTAETFEIDGHKAMVYAAPKPAAGKPWVWYAPTIKGVSIVQRRKP